MKIIDDIPGRRLKLTGEGTTLPSETRWVVLAAVSPLLLLPAGILWYVLSRTTVDPEHVLYSLVWLGGTVGVISRIWMSIRRFPALLDVDRAAGQARLGYGALFGGELDEEVLVLDKVERVTVQRLAPPESGASKAGSEITIRFDVCPWPGAGVQTSSMTIAVDGLDRSEEVVDFAFRLGAAAGLPSQRVVRNDPRAVEVELSRGAPAVTAPGPASLAPVPESLAPADFARDAAAPAAKAAVAQEIVEAFRPEAFAGDHEVKVWKPGVEVVFQRAWDGWVFLFGLPFLFLPLAWYLWQNNAGTLLYEELLQQTVVAGVIGAVIGIPSLVGMFSSKSRTVRLDWGPRTISIREGSRAQVIPMADVAALELDCRHEAEGGGGGGTGTHSNNVVIHRYECVVRLHWRAAGAPPASATLVETDVSDEPDSPYRQAIPLVTELARALGVERRVTDYDDRRARALAG
jgi:hypothetical protein